MKEVLLILLGLSIIPITNDALFIARHFGYKDASKFISWTPGIGVEEVVTARCTKDIGRNGHGWVFVKREYFKCNKLQIFFSDLIYGEYRGN